MTKYRIVEHTFQNNTTQYSIQEHLFLWFWMNSDDNYYETIEEAEEWVEVYMGNDEISKKVIKEYK